MRRTNISMHQVYERYIDWHKRVSDGADVNEIAEQEQFSVQTVKYGIKRISELLLIDKGIVRMYYGEDQPSRRTLLINDLHIQVKKRPITQLNYRSLQKSVKELLIILENENT